MLEMPGKRFTRASASLCGMMLLAAALGSGMLLSCTDVEPPRAMEALDKKDVVSVQGEGEAGEGGVTDAAVDAAEVLDVKTDADERGDAATQSNTSPGPGGQDSAAPQASVGGAQATADDPCLTDNGGCSNGAFCQRRDGEVVCSECPPDAIDSDGECGPALAELSITPGQLDRPFSSTKRVYRATVPLVVQQVSISVRAGSKGLVQIDTHSVGEQAYRTPLLAVGETTFDIIVRGADARDRRYNLTIVRGGKAPVYLKGDLVEASDNFGRAVAVHGDRVAVGAFYADSGDARDVGAVYMYKRAADTYEQVDRLTPEVDMASTCFGSALVMTDDTLVVGAPYLYTGPGKVYVYRREGERWIAQTTIASDQVDTDDWFGVTLALDGEILAIGATGTSTVYIYKRMGDDWQLVQRLPGPDGGEFGIALALQGSTLVVGAATTDSGRGSAYVFELGADGQFADSQALHVAEPPSAARFGDSVAIYGNVIAVGATGTLRPDYAHTGSDAVYLFDRKSDGWQARPVSVASKQTGNSSFGISVALLSETTLLVGAPDARAAGSIFGAMPGGSSAPKTGGIYMFADIGQGFVFDQLLNAPHAGAGDWFGYSLATQGGVLVISAMHEASRSRMVGGDAADNSCEQCGAAYVFE